ncbi:MAG TPA: outer membrane beta-barrel protein [Chitinophagaceae bacterium]|jgi:hypothetical protein|nr:outer membrane beta-barrel protein [Chitinophagaceae bacterium]
MKKILLFGIGCLLVTGLFAQDQTTKKKTKKQVDLSGRANDHLVLQFGYSGWSGSPDSVHTSGFPHSFNAYFMFDFPFKTNPHLSVAIGPGIGTDHIYFSKSYVGIKDITPTLRFQDLSDTTHFKKYKLATAWLEAPVELRYSGNPANPGKSFKAAIGLKVGTLLNAHTKGKTWVNAAGNTLIPYTEKVSSKRFFNTTRLVATARVGYGHFSLYGTYQVGSLFKEGLAANIKPFSIGLTLSGL